MLVQIWCVSVNASMSLELSEIASNHVCTPLIFSYLARNGDGTHISVRQVCLYYALVNFSI